MCDTNINCVPGGVGDGKREFAPQFWPPCRVSPEPVIPLPALHDSGSFSPPFLRFYPCSIRKPFCLEAQRVVALSSLHLCSRVDHLFVSHPALGVTADFLQVIKGTSGPEAGGE